MKEDLWLKLMDFITNAGLKLLLAVILLVVGIKLSKFISNKFLASKGLTTIDSGVKKFIANTIKILLYILVVISAAGILGIPYASFITVLGSAGVAIGLALQGSLSNIAAGILILINKPFKVGDVIEVGAFKGTVSEIGFFSSSFITADNRVVTYPNSSLTNSCIVNYSLMPTRRVDLTFSVAYDSDIKAVKELLLAAANSQELVIKDPVPEVVLSAFGDSAIEFTLRAWCNTDDYGTVMFSLNENCKTSLDENNIEIPYPTMDVNIRK